MVNGLTGLNTSLKAYQGRSKGGGPHEIATLGTPQELPLRAYELSLAGTPKGLKFVPQGEDIVDQLLGIGIIGGLGELAQQEAVNFTPLAYLSARKLHRDLLLPNGLGSTCTVVETQRSTTLLDEG